MVTPYKQMIMVLDLVIRQPPHYTIPELLGNKVKNRLKTLVINVRFVTIKDNKQQVNIKWHECIQKSIRPARSTNPD